MNIQEIILEKIEAVGADGICCAPVSSARANCTCSKDNLFAACHGFPLHSCILAKAVEKTVTTYIPLLSMGEETK